MSPCFSSLFVSSLAYPNLLGTKGYIVVVVVIVVVVSSKMLNFSWGVWEVFKFFLAS
jgi:hypothetical protein